MVDILELFYEYLHRDSNPIRVLYSSLNETDEYLNSSGRCFGFDLFIPQDFIEVCRKDYEEGWRSLLKKFTSEPIEIKGRNSRKWFHKHVDPWIVFKGLEGLEKIAETGEALISNAVKEIQKRIGCEGDSELVTSYGWTKEGVIIYYREGVGDPYWRLYEGE